jgi:FtsP/CotA-like multicopper oxidase with cupredoxin domain
MAQGMSDKTKVKLVWPIAGFCVVVAFGIGVISSAAFDSNQPALAAASSTAGEDQVVKVELGDLFIEPKKLQVAPGPVTFEVTNSGATEHNFVIEGESGTEMLASGESATLEVDLEVGEYKVICAVPGHAGGGMEGVLEVVEGAAPQAGSEDGDAMAGHGMSGMSAEEMVKIDTEVTASYPAKTEGLGGQPLEFEMVDGVKVFELTADEVEWEVEPGKVMDALAYNGVLPGPQIEAEVGDRVRIILNNELDQPTTLHFHGLLVPNAMDGVPVITQDAVMPGDSFTYEFTLKNSGTHMYHPHFNATEQITEGLLGAFIVKDPGETPADVDHTMVLNDGPLGFTINGKGFPATEPIVLKQGETLRLRYMNEGLQIHPMHLHGLVQRVITKDGWPLDSPYDVDTLMIAPGERYDVIVKADAPGVWAFHCHILSHVEGPEGMFGMVTAVIVE